MSAWHWMALTVFVHCAASANVSAQEIAVSVWQIEQGGSPTAQPAAGVEIEATKALNNPFGQPAGNDYVRKLTPQTEPHQYALSLGDAPPLIDVTILKLGFHPLTIRDLSVGPNRSHIFHVQLLDRKLDYRAPECFALKSEYEFLFRKEQQLAPPEERRMPAERRRAAAAHRARLKYADGILSLPNPNRPDSTQSRATLRMLDAMDGDDLKELEDMMAGLFDVFEMDTMASFVPSVWTSRFSTGNRNNPERRCEIRLQGTYGTYKTLDDGHVHRLENVDISQPPNEDGPIITGQFRFEPGTGREVRGQFRWRVNDSYDGFTSEGWSGELVRGPDDEN